MGYDPGLGSEPTAQQVFDVVARHLLKQGARSMLEPDVCAYRSPDGLMCAVGACISDEEYSPSLDADAVHVEVALDMGLLPAGLRPHQPLLNELQILHDSIEVRHWAFGLRETARLFGLSAAVLDST